jgi:hypothetical protein
LPSGKTKIQPFDAKSSGKDNSAIGWQANQTKKSGMARAACKEC